MIYTYWQKKNSTFTEVFICMCISDNEKDPYCMSRAQSPVRTFWILAVKKKKPGRHQQTLRIHRNKN